VSLSRACERLAMQAPVRVFFWWIIIRNVVRVLIKVLYRYEVIGREHVPADGPMIYASNHQSHLDPCLIGSAIGAYAPIGRSGLFDTGIMRWILEGLGTISIEQGRGDTAAIKAAIGVLQRGGRVLIFPEGSRTADGAMDDFKAGTMLLVRRAKVPVLPIAVEGIYDIWPRGRSLPRLRGRMTMMVGRPIPAQELLAVDPDAALERLQREIEAMRMTLRERLRRRSGGRYPAPGPGDVPWWDRPDAPAPA